MQMMPPAMPLAAIVAALLLHCADAFRHVLVFNPSCKQDLAVEYKVGRNSAKLPSPVPEVYTEVKHGEHEYLGFFTTVEARDQLFLRVKGGGRQEEGIYLVEVDKIGHQAEITVADVKFQLFVHDVHPSQIWGSMIVALAARRDAGSLSDDVVKEQIPIVFRETVAAAGKFFVLVFMDNVPGEFVTLKYSGDHAHEAAEERRDLVDNALFAAVNLPDSAGTVTVRTAAGAEASVALSTDLFTKAQVDGGSVYILVTKSRNHFDQAWRHVHGFHNAETDADHPYWKFSGQWNDAELQKLVDLELVHGGNLAVRQDDQMTDEQPYEQMQGQGCAVIGKFVFLAIIVATLIAAAAYYHCCTSAEDVIVDDRSREDRSDDFIGQPSMHGEHWPLESVRNMELRLHQAGADNGADEGNDQGEAETPDTHAV